MSGTINLGGILNPANVQPVAPPPPPNLLGMAAQGIDLQNGLYQNALNQRNLQGQLALGRAYQNNTDPNTGVTNFTGVASDLASDPAGGAALPGFSAAMLERQKAQLDLNRAGLAQTTARTGVFNSALIPLLRLGSNVTTGDIYNVVAGLHSSGIPTDEAIADMQNTLPVKDPAQNNNPAYQAAYGRALQGWVVDHAGRALAPDSAAHLFSPSITPLDTGGTIAPTDLNPYTSPGVTGAPIGKTLSPGEATAPTPGPVGPGGAPTTISRAGFAAGQGLNGLIPGGSPFGNGRGGSLPPSLLNPNRAPAGGGIGGTAPGAGGGSGGAGGNGSTGAPSALPTPMVTGLGPGQETGIAAAGKASADQWAALQQQVGGTAAGGGSAGRIFQLQSALADLTKLGQTGSGPSAGTVNTVKSYLASLPLVGTLMPPGAVNSIANYDQANKALTLYASARAGAHGGTTDSQLATTLTGNASTHISNLAAQNVVRVNIALERMDQAQAEAFQSATDPQTGKPLTPDQFSTWSANWNRTNDPRAFMVDQLSPQQFQKTIASMSPTDRTKFQNTYNTAVRNGWVSPPSWVAPSAGAPATGGPGQPDTGPSAVYPTGPGS